MDDAQAPGDRVAALTALYQAERSDEAAKQTLNAAVVGLALTYAGITLGLINQVPLEQWIFVLLPAPLWVVAVYLGLFAATQRRRGRSVVVLEHHLLEIAALSPREREVVGQTALRDVREWRSASTPNRASLVITFGGELALLLAYTVYMVNRGSGEPFSSIQFAGPVVGYLISFGVLAASWITNLRPTRGR